MTALSFVTALSMLFCDSIVICDSIVKVILFCDSIIKVLIKVIEIKIILSLTFISEEEFYKPVKIRQHNFHAAKSVYSIKLIQVVFCDSNILYFKVNGYTFRGSNSASFSFPSFLYRGKLLKQRICS